MIDEEQIKQARQVNLADYLISKGEKLIKNGNRYRHSEHSSLVFTNNLFYWNSQQLKGNAIDFLVSYYGMSFLDAVTELTSTDPYFQIEKQPKPKDEKQPFDFSKIQLDTTTDQAFTYLTKHRVIHIDLISSLIRQNAIYQEAKTKNIIFPMKDENRNIVGIEYHGSYAGKSFKGVAKNSKYGYGFNIIFNKPEHAVFFESAIDLISFIQIKLIENRPLQTIILISMAGLKANVVSTMMNTFKIPNPPIICVDNDNAGINFCVEIKKTYPNCKVYLPKVGKDWNDSLISQNSNLNKPKAPSLE